MLSSCLMRTTGILFCLLASACSSSENNQSQPGLDNGATNVAITDSTDTTSTDNTGGTAGDNTTGSDPAPNVIIPNNQGNVLYSYSFDSADDLTDPEQGSGSASIYSFTAHTSTTGNTTGAWDGHSFVRVQLTNTDANGVPDDENNAGIYIPLDHLNITGTMSIGWVSRYGPTFFDAFILGGMDYNANNKIAMLRVGDGTSVVHQESPQMIITPAHNPPAYHVPQISTAPSNVGRQDEFGREYPTDHNDNHQFRFEDYLNEWVYYEITNIPSDNSVSLSIYTRDGLISFTPLASTVSDTALTRELYAFRFIAYLHEISGADNNSYADLSDIYVGDGHMGPPAGFIQ